MFRMYASQWVAERQVLNLYGVGSRRMSLCGTDGMMPRERKTKVLGESSVGLLVPNCPPQISHGLLWDWILASAVRGRWRSGPRRGTRREGWVAAEKCETIVRWLLFCYWFHWFAIGSEFLGGKLANSERCSTRLLNVGSGLGGRYCVWNVPEVVARHTIV